MVYCRKTWQKSLVPAKRTELLQQCKCLLQKPQQAWFILRSVGLQQSDAFFIDASSRVNNQSLT